MTTQEINRAAALVRATPILPDLSVEISGVCGFDEADGVTTCNDEVDRAEAFAVYIRNPLAFHVQDFPLIPAGDEALADILDAETLRAKAKAAAFAYANALAEHLGCGVASRLNREA